MRLKLIACEILYREACAVVARSINKVDVEFLPKGLHDIGQTGMSTHLAQALASVDESRYDAVLFGYALCGNGLLGLTARGLPLVIPRAHDCITLFLGNKERYLEYFRAHPGIYFKTCGWIERGEGLTQFSQDSIQQQTGMAQSYEKLVEKYGEDNAQFLRQQLTDMTRNYGGIAYIATGVEPDDRFEQQARAEAAERHWSFERLEGSLSLLQRLVDGPWNEADFLTVPPGRQIAASFNEQIVKVVESASSCGKMQTE